MVQFSTLTISSHTLAFLTIAPLITVERTFIEQFGHLVCIEITLSNNLASTQEKTLECFLLNQCELRSKQQQENGECGIQRLVLQVMQELFLGKVLFATKNTMSDIGGSFFKSLLVLSQHDYFDGFIENQFSFSLVLV